MIDKPFYLALIALLSLVLVSCAARPPTDRSTGLTRVDLLDDAAFGVTEQDQVVLIDLLGVNDDMRDFLREQVPDHFAPERKVDLILKAILSDGLRLEYDSFKTYSAEEAFYSRQGNCLSFTNLFVALAREAGLKVEFQEVDVPPNWERRGNSYLFNRHINALVHLPFSSSKAVDFDITEFDLDYPRRRITDNYAMAQYYNNVAVHRLGQDELKPAYLNLRKAIELYPHAPYFWTNLGSLYHHSGDDFRAEASWLEALRVGDEPSALSNLARLYRRENEEALAAWYDKRAEKYRRKNPFYLFELGKTAYNDGDYPEAVSLLKKAVRLRQGEHEFHRFLGLSYLQLGEKKPALRSFYRAEQSADGDVQRRRYNEKQRLLVQVVH